MPPLDLADENAVRQRVAAILARAGVTTLLPKVWARVWAIKTRGRRLWPWELAWWYLGELREECR